MKVAMWDVRKAAWRVETLVDPTAHMKAARLDSPWVDWSVDLTVMAPVAYLVERMAGW